MWIELLRGKSNNKITYQHRVAADTDQYAPWAGSSQLLLSVLIRAVQARGQARPDRRGERLCS